MEAEIKKLKKQLVQLRQKNFADLETEENLRAEYDNRAPRYPKDLIEEEEKRVEKERTELKRDIKVAEDRLEEIYPQAVRIVAQEEEKK